MNWFDQLLSYFTEANAMAIMLLALFIVILLIFTKLQLDRDSAFNLEDLICHNGRLDEKKFARFGAWVLSSWGFVYLMVKNPDSLPEWYFIGYMGVWVSNVIIEKFVSNRSSDRDSDRDSDNYYHHRYIQYRPPSDLARPTDYNHPER
jgi:hypothetical protein